MTKQKINTPGLYQKDATKMIPTAEPVGIYFALRYLYDSDNKDVNDWYFKHKHKHKEKYKAACWTDVPSKLNPWKNY